MRFFNDVRLLRQPAAEESAASGFVTFGHIDLDALIEAGYLDGKALDEAYSFAVVRNPFSRAVSLWQYLARRRVIPTAWTFDTFVKQVVRERPGLGPFNELSLSQAAPMSDWVFPRLWGGPRDLFRFESLREGAEALQERFVISSELPRENSALSKSLQPVPASSATIQKILDFYEVDFDKFGYSDLPPKGVFEINQ